MEVKNTNMEKLYKGLKDIELILSVILSTTATDKLWVELLKTKQRLIEYLE